MRTKALSWRISRNIGIIGRGLTAIKAIERCGMCWRALYWYITL